MVDEGDLKGKYLSEVEGDPFLEEFNVMPDSSQFHLEKRFQVKMSNCEAELVVRLDENRLWHSIYCIDSLYQLIGKEACALLDFAYNMGGSEAISETYFSVMEAQKQSNQDNDTLDMRTLISFCMPPPSNCPKAIEEIASLYLNGDVKNKVAKHRANIFYDRRGRALKNTKSVKL